VLCSRTGVVGGGQAGVARLSAAPEVAADGVCVTGRCLRLHQGRSRARLLLGRVCSICYRQSLVAALHSSRRAGRHALAPAPPFAALPAALPAIPALLAALPAIPALLAALPAIPALPAALRTPRLHHCAFWDVYCRHGQRRGCRFARSYAICIWDKFGLSVVLSSLVAGRCCLPVFVVPGVVL